MLSSHQILACETYMLTHFPFRESLIIPPETSWKFGTKAFLYRRNNPEGTRPYGDKYANVCAYDTYGVLEIEYEVVHHSTFTNKNGTTVQNLAPETSLDTCYIEGTFSREDIAMFATHLREGMGGQFIPKNTGLAEHANWAAASFLQFYPERLPHSVCKDDHRYLKLDDIRPVFLESFIKGFPQ
jgi:hypothetical protein